MSDDRAIEVLASVPFTERQLIRSEGGGWPEAWTDRPRPESDIVADQVEALASAGFQIRAGEPLPADREQPEDVPVPECECGLAPGEPCDQCENPGPSREQPAGLREALERYEHCYSPGSARARQASLADAGAELAEAVRRALAAALPEGRPRGLNPDDPETSWERNTRTGGSGHD